MDVGLFIQFFGLTLAALLMILIVKGFKVEKLQPWDYVLFFFAGFLWPVVFPVLVVYLGVYYVTDRKTRKP